MMTASPQDRVLLALKRKRAILRARKDLIEFTKLTRPSPDYPDDADYSTYVPVRHHKAVAAALPSCGLCHLTATSAGTSLHGPKVG